MQPARVYGHDRIHIGSDVTIFPNAFLSVVETHDGRSFGAKLVIGDRCQLGRDLVVACFGAVEIGPDVLAADRVFIGDTYRDYRDPSTPIRQQPLVEPRPVKIGAGAFLGINCCIMPGVTIGDRAYVGAGAVVTSDVPSLSVVVGNPATVVREYDPSADAWTAAAHRLTPG
jgi:acetyltransferase-like isoleucine patch superfamily enzyme